MSSFKASVEGPRWARADIAIERLFSELGIDKFEVRREVWLLREIVTFKVFADDELLIAIRDEILSGINKYNNGVDF